MRRALATVALVTLLITTLATGSVDAAPDAKLREDIRSRVDVGLNWLRWKLTPAGTYGDSDVTTNAVRAFALSHRRYVADDGPFMRRPVEFLTAQLAAPDLSMARRASVVLALASLSNDPRRDLIDAQVPLLTNWLRDASGAAAAPDLESVSVVADALAVAGGMDAGPRGQIVALAQRAVSRLATPGNEEALRALAIGRAEAGAPGAATEAARAQLAASYGWWEREATPPSLAYLLALTRALQATGGSTIKDAAGRDRDWAIELAQLVIARQQFDGFWQENEQVAATINGVATLEILYNVK